MNAEQLFRLKQVEKQVKALIIWAQSQDKWNALTVKAVEEMAKAVEELGGNPPEALGSGEDGEAEAAQRSADHGPAAGSSRPGHGALGAVRNGEVPGDAGARSDMAV